MNNATVKPFHKFLCVYVFSFLMGYIPRKDCNCWVIGKLCA